MAGSCTSHKASRVLLQNFALLNYQELWEIGKHCIILYAHETIENKHFMCAIHFWSNWFSLLTHLIAILSNAAYKIILWLKLIEISFGSCFPLLTAPIVLLEVAAIKSCTKINAPQWSAVCWSWKLIQLCAECQPTFQQSRHGSRS